jgi:hypothetical protein
LSGCFTIGEQGLFSIATAISNVQPFLGNKDSLLHVSGGISKNSQMQIGDDQHMTALTVYI